MPLAVQGRVFSPRRTLHRNAAKEREQDLGRSRQGGAWTPAEDARLCHAITSKQPFATICATHDRSARDVRERLALLQPRAARDSI